MENWYCVDKEIEDYVAEIYEAVTSGNTWCGVDLYEVYEEISQ